jgi:hypothetical protein
MARRRSCAMECVSALKLLSWTINLANQKNAKVCYKIVQAVDTWCSNRLYNKTLRRNPFELFEDSPRSAGPDAPISVGRSPANITVSVSSIQRIHVVHESFVEMLLRRREIALKKDASFLCFIYPSQPVSHGRFPTI